MKRQKFSVLVQLIRITTDTRVWVSFDTKNVGSLLKDGDCQEIERQIQHDYPDFFVYKWAKVPAEAGKDLLCNGLEEVFFFASEF